MPVPIFSPTALPVTSSLPLPRQRCRSRSIAGCVAGRHRLRPRLHDVELAVLGVLGPFDVHRHRMAGRGGVVLLDADRVVGQRQHLGIVEAEARARRLGRVGSSRVVAPIWPAASTMASCFCPSVRRSTARWPCRKVGLWT